MIERKPFGPADIRIWRVNGQVEVFPADSTVNINEAWLVTVTAPGRMPRQFSEYEWIEVATPDGTTVTNESPNRAVSPN